MRAKPKKSLGQNFLVDANIRRKILSSLNLSQKDTVLEIGAGRGELTAMIASSAGKLHAVEVDTRLYAELKAEFSGNPNVELIQADILEFDISKYFGRKKVKAFGNIPYYISSPIIEHLCRYKASLTSAYLTLQKEFALRLVAKPGSKDFGAFSLFTQYHFNPKILFNISAGCFRPKPKVDSAFIELTPRSDLALGVAIEKWLFTLTRGAFSQRRKTLRNSLSQILPAKKLEKFFVERKLDFNIRPECLSLDDFIHMANL